MKFFAGARQEGPAIGLDASVHCHCFERGLVRTPPDPKWGVHVCEDGTRTTASKDLYEQLAFDAWDAGACDHENGVMLHHYLGNIALVALFRDLLRAHADRLPVVTTKVIHNGTHCGDWLSLADVHQLAHETDVIMHVHADDPREEQFLRHFEQQLRELTLCSLKIGKPIVF